MNRQTAVEAIMEATLQAALDGARCAKDEGQESALFAYYDVLQVGLSMAREDGVELNSELARVDPDTLIDIDRDSSAA